MVVDSSIESDNAWLLKVVKNHIIKYQNQANYQHYFEPVPIICILPIFK